MLQELRPAIVGLIVLSLITGLLYPLAVTAVAQSVFPAQANGSLIERDQRVIGSRLIGQPFDDARYFWGRLSGTTPSCNAGSSSGSNFGPLNPALIDAAKARISALRALDGVSEATDGSVTSAPTKPASAQRIAAGARVPVDLVTASGSGLDPHISPAAARYQVARVARARGIDAKVVAALVDAHIEGRTFGVLGEPRVNVLELNVALDALR